MIRLRFRTVAAGAARLKRIARRIAGKLGRRGGVRREVHDGYVVSVRSKNERAAATIVDPAALWAFLGHQAVGDNLDLSLYARHLDRGRLTPKVDDSGLPIEDRLGKPVEEALVGWAPGFGYLPPFTAPATVGLIENVPATIALAPDRMASTHLIFDRQPGPSDGTAYSTKLYLYGHATNPMRRRIIERGTSMAGEPVRVADVQDWIVSEDALRDLSGDPYLQVVARGGTSNAGGADIPYAPSPAAWDVRSDELLAGRLWYSGIAIVGCYVTQPDEEEDSSYLRQTGLFVVRLRRPEPAEVKTARYALTVDDQLFLRVLDSPHPDLIPDTLPEETITPTDGEPYTLPETYSPHSVLSVGAAVIAGDPDATSDSGRADGFMAVFSVTCTKGARDPETHQFKPTHRASALQVITLAAGGAVTHYLPLIDKVTANSEGVESGDPMRRYGVGPALRMFDKAGVLVAAVFEAGSPSPQLWHIGEDGVARETGLASAGLVPFIPAPSIPVYVGLYGQAQRWACDIGGDRVAVLAFTAGAMVGEPIAFKVVVLDALTGDVVETAGSLPDLPSGMFINAHITCVTPRVLDDSDVETAPALLVVALYDLTFLSRDGGKTWGKIFEGYFGCPVYLGNRLHPVELGVSL